MQEQRMKEKSTCKVIDHNFAGNQFLLIRNTLQAIKVIM